MPAVATRTTMPVLSHVLLSTGDSGLSASATNLEMWVERTLSQVEVTRSGAITVPARLLAEFVHGLPDVPVHLVSDDEAMALHIQCNNFDANIKGIDAQEFPVVPTPDDLTWATVEANTFARMVDGVALAAAKDQSRPVLAGILLVIGDDVISMYAADGYRLAHCVEPLTTSPEQPISAIVPTATMRQIAKVANGTVDLALNDTRLFVRSGDVHLVALLIEGEYPDLSHTIPSEQTTSVIVATDEITQATRIARIFARDTGVNSPMHIIITPPDTIVITAESAEHGDNSSKLNGKVEGEAVDLTINVRYVLDALAMIDTASTRIGITDSVSPITARPEYGRDVGVREAMTVMMPLYSSR